MGSPVGPGDVGQWHAKGVRAFLEDGCAAAAQHGFRLRNSSERREATQAAACQYCVNSHGGLRFRLPGDADTDFPGNFNEVVRHVFKFLNQAKDCLPCIGTLLGKYGLVEWPGNIPCARQ